jgi:hypothetical protein
MTLDTLIMLGGALVALLPFLGFPNSWDRVLLFLLGAFIVVLGMVVRRRIGYGRERGTRREEVFVENNSRFAESHEET